MLQLQVIGNLTKNAETRLINGVNYIAATIAVNVGRDRTEFISLRKRIGEKDNLSQHMTKGRKIYAQGAMSVQTYTKQSGDTEVDITLWADKIEFCSSPQAEINVKEFAGGMESYSATQSENNNQQPNNEIPF